jgi:penicillin amidase
MNLTYADARGHIGQVLAYGQPVLRDPAKTLDLIKQTDNPIVAVRGPLDLPELADPPEGFLASANNRPAPTEIPIAFQYAGSDRVERMQQLAGGQAQVAVGDLMAWQRDVYSASSHALARELVRRCEGMERELEEEGREGSGGSGGWEQERELWRAVAGWDGHYRSGDAGPVAFEALLHGLSQRLLRRLAVSPKVADLLLSADNWKGTVRAEVERLDDATLRAELLEALHERRGALAENPTWGVMHVQRIQHPLGNLPLVGGRYRVLDYGADGSNDTLLKAAHDFTGERSRVTYGATARHVSDLSDPDANWFVLLGGQDGWLDGPHLADQVPLWREGRYLHLPLQVEAIEKEFRTRVRLQPGAP